MADKPSDPDGRALWQRVAETVRPLKGRRLTGQLSPPQQRGAGEGNAVRQQMSRPARPYPSLTNFSPNEETAKRLSGSANTLDGGWDKRLSRGIVVPEFTIDLHGHTLAGAHAELESGLTLAVSCEARIILLITGKPPPSDRSRLDHPLRGVIRASIGDWLSHSRHAARIAAVRNAHPRHGGAGALYVILRRERG